MYSQAILTFVLNAQIFLHFFTDIVKSETTRTFYGNRKGSFLTYPLWNISSTGILRLRFKTHEANAILFYSDDHLQQRGNGNFMKVKLVDTRLQISIQVSFYVNDNVLNTQTLRRGARLGINLNDNFYHFVQIQRAGDVTKVTVDGNTELITIQENYLYFNSSLYFGGVPYVSRLFVDSDVIYEKRFIGCISNFNYDNSLDFKPSKLQITPTEEHHTVIGCQNMCLIRESTTCLNHGRCLNRYYETGCDCRGTGYSGETCDKKTTSIYLAGYDYLSWKPDVLLSSYSTQVIIRFLTAQSSGILFYACGEKSEDEYMLLELYQKSLIFHYKNKESKTEIIQLGDNEINQTFWRIVYIYRYGNSISVKLDDSHSVRRYLKNSKHLSTSKMDYLKLTKMFIGGVINPAAVLASKSKKHFNGCIQDIFINQVNFIEKLFDKKDSNGIGRHGNIIRGCKTYVFFKDKSVPIPYNPSLVVNQSIAEEGKEYIGDVRGRKNNKNDSLDRTFHLNNRVTWLVIGICAAVVVITICSIVVGRIVFKRKVKKIQYRAEYIKQTKSKEKETTNFLPVLQSSQSELKKCTDRIERRNLQTFSPDRKIFYASPDAIIPVGHQL